MTHVANKHSVEVPASTKLTLTKEEKAVWTTKLNNYAKEFLCKNFPDVAYPKVVINGRLITKLGCCYYERDSNGREIEIAGRHIKSAILAKSVEGAEEGVYDTLRHELMHWVLYCHDIDSSDGDLGFETLLSDVCASSSGAIHSNQSVKKVVPVVINHYYVTRCQGCGSYSKTDTKGCYYCGPCFEAGSYQRLTYPLLRIEVTYNYKEGVLENEERNRVIKINRRLHKTVERA